MISPSPERRPARRQHRVRPRHGTVLVVVLLAMLVLMAMIGATLQGALRARRQLAAQRDLRQTQLLLQAGSDRAAFRLRTEPNYDGETWTLPADQIVGRGDGQVTIATSRDADDAAWQVHVVAEYPLGGMSSIRRSRTFNIQPQPSQAEE